MTEVPPITVYQLLCSIVEAGMLVELRASVVKVFLIMAVFADANLTVGSHAGTLGRLAGLDRRTVYRCLKTLRRKGLVELIESGRGRHCGGAYKLVPPFGQLCVTGGGDCASHDESPPRSYEVVYGG